MGERLIILILLVSAQVAAAHGGCLAGTVLEHGGAPLAQMHVYAYGLTNALSQTTDTDEHGHFQFNNLTSDTYDVVTRNEDLGYPDNNNFHFSGKFDRLRVAVEGSGECAHLTIRREPRAAKIRLLLTDGATGEPLSTPEAFFRRKGDPAWDEISVYGDNLLVPPSEPLEVQVGAQGHRSSEILPIAPLQSGEVHELAMALQPLGLGCLKGTVFDENKKPVPEISVHPLLTDDFLNAKALETHTDKYGRFDMRDLHPGVYWVSVYDKNKGYDVSSTEHLDVSVQAAKRCAELTINLRGQRAKLEVDIVDASTHQAISRFKYTVRSAVPKDWWYQESAEKGTLVPPDKPCSVQVESRGYLTSEPVFLGSLSPGEVRSLTVELQPANGDKVDLPSQP
jgi:protocatechuate 3,4-dioxygenase beta subunit